MPPGQEIEQLKRENGDLKEIVADLLLETHRLKKNRHPTAKPRHRRPHMSATRKAEIMEKVQAIPLADPAGATTTRCSEEHVLQVAHRD